MAEKRETRGGKRAGAGRKTKTSEEELLALFKKCWPNKQREEAIKTYVQRALKGDLESFKILMAYVYGKPKEKHEHSGPDGGHIPISIESRILQVYGDPADGD